MLKNSDLYVTLHKNLDTYVAGNTNSTELTDHVKTMLLTGQHMRNVSYR